MQTPKNQLSVNSNMGTKEREGGGAGERDGCWNRRNKAVAHEGQGGTEGVKLGYTVKGWGLPESQS